MNETQDRAQAYSFDLQADQSHGSLRIGNVQSPVTVKQFSWSGYTIEVPPSISSKRWLGKRGSLSFQGNQYAVNCKSHEVQTDGKFLLQLERIDNDAAKSRKRKKKSALSGSIALTPKNPVLGIAGWLCLVALFLILPGWGENWGTSKYLSDGIYSIVANGSQACRNILGR